MTEMYLLLADGCTMELQRLSAVAHMKQSFVVAIQPVIAKPAAVLGNDGPSCSSYPDDEERVLNLVSEDGMRLCRQDKLKQGADTETAETEAVSALGKSRHKVLSEVGSLHVFERMPTTSFVHLRVVPKAHYNEMASACRTALATEYYTVKVAVDRTEMAAVYDTGLEAAGRQLAVAAGIW